MQNYFNYFTEIEQRFQQRRGSLLFLSTLDWALIETWKEAGVPLEAVLRGIDVAFDKHDARSATAKGRLRKVNGLAWCAQSVMEATERASEAAVGAARDIPEAASGFEAEPILRYLESNAAQLAEAELKPPADSVATEIAARLRALGTEMQADPGARLEDLDRTLTVLEEKMFAALMTATPDTELADLREAAAREIAPYRGKMQAVQIRQVQGQILQKRLLANHKLPRLSLFYMSHG